MPRAKKEVTNVSCILDSFPNIGKADKNKFLKFAEKYDISQEELLKLAVEAVVKGKVKFKTKTTIELADW